MPINNIFISNAMNTLPVWLWCTITVRHFFKTTVEFPSLPGVLSFLVLSCLGDYVSVTVWYDETVVVGLAVKLAV